MSDVLGSIREIVEAERRKLLGSFEKAWSKYMNVFMKSGGDISSSLNM